MFIFVWEAASNRNAFSAVRSDKASAHEFVMELKIEELPDWVIVQDEDDSAEFESHAGAQWVIDNLLQ